jgi:hypothetical protein
LLLACILGIGVNGFLYYPVLDYLVHGNNDFVCYYAAAELSGTSGLYDQPTIIQAQKALGNHQHAVVFTRLPYYAAWISFLRFFNFDVAYWIWQTLSVCGVLIFIYFWPGDRWATAFACCWSLPMFEGFLSGQDVPLLLAAIAVSMSLRARGRDLAAGCVLSICSVKYHLFLTLPLLIVRHRMWSLARGLVAGGAVLLLVSFVVQGWSWPRQYIAILTRPDTTPPNVAMPNVRGLTAGLPYDRFWELAGVGLVLLAAWLVIRSKDVSLGFAATLASGLLIGDHAFLRDAVLLIPACLLMWQSSCGAPCRFTALLMLSPIPYLSFIASFDPHYRPSVLIPLPLLVMAAVQVRRRWFQPAPVAA